ncbi:hypothetical protein ACCT19_17120 [Rhizobium ruizarguesonis]
MSNSVGRPLTTIADLVENWRDIMHTIYADGGSDAEVKIALAVPPSRAISNMLWDDLQAREPEFSEAIREGRILAEMWWQRKGREGLFTCEGLKFSSQLWFMNMKNRFGWKDRQEVEHSADKNAPPVFTLKIDNS